MNHVRFECAKVADLHVNEGIFSLSCGAKAPLEIHLSRQSSHQPVMVLDDDSHQRGRTHPSLPSSLRSLTVSLAHSPPPSNHRSLHVSAELSSQEPASAAIRWELCTFVRANIKLLDSRLAVCCERQCSDPLNLIKSASLSLNNTSFVYFVSLPISTIPVSFDAFITDSDLASPLNLPKCSLGNGRDLRSVQFERVCMRLFRSGTGYVVEWKKTGRVTTGHVECDIARSYLSHESITITTLSKDTTTSSEKLIKTTHSLSNDGRLLQLSQDAVAPQASAPFYIRAELTPASGFHPSYHLTVTTSFPYQLAAAPASIVAIVLHVPLNEHAFVDPFQVAGLNRVNGRVRYWSYGEPDLEAPASDAIKARHNGVFVVIKDVDEFLASGVKTVEVPFHMRYQPPSANGGYVSIPVNSVSAHILMNGSKSSFSSQASSLDASEFLPALLAEAGLLGAMEIPSIVPVMVDHVGPSAMRMPVGAESDRGWVLATLLACVVVSCGYVMEAFLRKFGGRRNT